ncbi:magnesium/cobalt transporter CorA [Candidatus Woesearchaeota archaeon]|nr:magnesium/cobalt transporter CorA [Candidatus Woesearchaeota archaeon]
MIEGYKIQKNQLVNAKASDLASKDFVWLDYTNPSEKELKDLSEATDIPFEYLENVHFPTERPKIFEYGNYSMIIYGSAYHNRTSFNTQPVFILISENNNVITLKQQEHEAFAKIKALNDEQKKILMQNQTYFIYRLLDNLNNQFFSVLEEVEDIMESIEHEVMHTVSKTIVNKIFRVKKSIIYFHKALIANREVVTMIEKEYLSIIVKKELRRFRDVYNDVIQLIDLEETYRDILTNVLEIYLTNISNNMNEVVKKLTVYGSFVLVPTLIASIYGMNFKNMPELFWHYGYFFSIGFMALSVLAMYLTFKRYKWI